MITKALKRKEVELGFIHIPANNRLELLGEMAAPFETKLNDEPAKVDKFGRIWSHYLKQKYPVNTAVTITKNGNGFQLVADVQGQSQITIETVNKPKSTKPKKKAAPQKSAMSENNRKQNIQPNAESIRSIQLEEIKLSNVEPFFHTDSVWIFNENVIDTTAIQEKSIDLVITSPPYNVDIKYNSHDDKISYEEYLEFSRKWMSRCFEWLRNDGRFCLNIPLDKNKNGQQSVGADLTTIAKKIGFKYHSTIVWNEGNISRRTAWGSWMRASAPFVIAPVELIVVLYKENWKKTSGSRVSDIARKDFMDWTNGLWTFQGESAKRTGHPAPFPVELPHRCMKLFSYVGDVVLDPFLGSGTTLVAAAIDKRRGIGIDIDSKYCMLAKKRLIKEAHILDTVLPAGESNGTEGKGRSGQVTVRPLDGILQEEPKPKH